MKTPAFVTAAAVALCAMSADAKAPMHKAPSKARATARKTPRNLLKKKPTITAQSTCSITMTSLPSISTDALGNAIHPKQISAVTNRQFIYADSGGFNGTPSLRVIDLDEDPKMFSLAGNASFSALQVGSGGLGACANAGFARVNVSPYAATTWDSTCGDTTAVGGDFAFLRTFGHEQLLRKVTGPGQGQTLFHFDMWDSAVEFRAVESYGGAYYFTAWDKDALYKLTEGTGQTFPTKVADWELPNRINDLEAHPTGMIGLSPRWTSFQTDTTGLNQLYSIGANGSICTLSIPFVSNVNDKSFFTDMDVVTVPGTNDIDIIVTDNQGWQGHKKPLIEGHGTIHRFRVNL